MKNHEIKVKVKNYNYSILIGKNTLNVLPKKIKLLCPKTKNVALIIDKNVPKKFKKALKNKLKNYNLLILSFSPSEKNKSLSKINYFLKILLSKNFNRSDLIISVGGGITGDVVGFVASIFKRGINFINIPTTLLAQVDSAIGGKTGVNSNFGKNLIGSFYQPRLVVSDISFISSEAFVNTSSGIFTFLSSNCNTFAVGNLLCCPTNLTISSNTVLCGPSKYSF